MTLTNLTLDLNIIIRFFSQFARGSLSRVYIWMRTEWECGMRKRCKRLIWMCYLGEANSIRLCHEHLANSQTLSINGWYFKGHSLMIHLDVNKHDSLPSNRVYLLPRWMPNNVRMYREQNANVACENDANIWCRCVTKVKQTAFGYVAANAE